MTRKAQINRNCLLYRELKVKLYKRCDYCDHPFWDCLGTQFNLTAMVAFTILLILPYLTPFPLLFKIATLTIILCFLVLGYFVNTKTDALYYNEFTLKDKTRALTRANEELKKLDQVKSDFIATVSHEFRTPLTSIKAFSHILLNDAEQVSAKEYRDFLEIIDQESNRLSRLVDNILDLSKLEAGEMDWHMEVLSLEELIVKGIQAITPLYRVKKITIENRVGPGTLPPVRGDPDRLFQVLANLFNNSFKFTPPRGRLIVHAGTTGSMVSINMEDTGPGIRKDQLETIFSKFKQCENTLIDKPHGTGLGLSICREIIENHGGRIWAENRSEGGIRITFTLPCSQRNILPEISGRELIAENQKTVG